MIRHTQGDRQQFLQFVITRSGLAELKWLERAALPQETKERVSIALCSVLRSGIGLIEHGGLPIDGIEVGARRR